MDPRLAIVSRQLSLIATDRQRHSLNCMASFWHDILAL
jgi:hypothetical protein